MSVITGETVKQQIRRTAQTKRENVEKRENKGKIDTKQKKKGPSAFIS